MLMGVRERFINSIECLRELGFFEDYSGRSSEEIFERISEGDILLSDLDKKEEKWAKESDFEIDVLIASKDKKRVWWGFDYDELPNPGVGLKYLNGLASISRGVFQPKNAREEYKLYKDEYGLDVGYCKVYFIFEKKVFTLRGEKIMEEEKMLEFPWSEVHRWEFRHAMNELNRLIEHTGYQYYQILCPDMYLFVVLKPWEARKLDGEREWELRGMR